MSKKLIFILFVASQSLTGNAQQNTGFAAGGNFDTKKQETKWAAKNLFENKVFIENKGQFDSQARIKNADIQYAVSSSGMQIYFTSKGLTYSHSESKMTKAEWEEKEKNERGGQKEMEREAEEMLKQVQKYCNMEWIGANPEVQIIAEEAVSHYFTYPDHNDLSGRSTLKATAYKKITYKNLYPGIDAEYIFPEGKTGIKYSLIVHPGADASVIKMKYSKADEIVLDNQGNFQIETPFGKITDHAPVTFYEGGTNIKSAFELNGNTISFQLDNSYDHSQTVIIDPWTSVPSFLTYNSAYDVDYDVQGNVYIYGGSNPFQEMKFNSSGTLQWVFTNSLVSPFWFGGFYGDFAVDNNSGSSYIAQGVGSAGATKVAKLNSAGGIVGFFMGDPDMDEIWKIAINSCTHQAIIGTANHNSSNPSQAAMLDTNVTAMTFVNVLNAPGSGNDPCFLAIDNSNNCFMAIAKSVTGGTFNNIMLKFPANTFFPTAWMVSDGYNFRELVSVTYVNNQYQGANGFNGMAVNNNFLVTYDGSVLKKWDKNSGALLNSTVVTGTSFAWGGLALDDCDNIFVGANTAVKRYDANLNLISTTAAANTIFDVKLGPSNKLYVCGDGFVSEMQLTLSPCSIFNTSAQITNAGCSSLGSATVTVNGGTPPYTITWNTNPVQTGNTASNLPAGTYIATITDNSCVKKIEYDTVIITSAGLPNLSVNSVTICDGAAATLTASGANTYTWSPPTGLNTTSGPVVIANPNATTTYTVTGTVTGCSGTITATITVNPLPVLSVNSATVCPGGTVTITASGATTYTWNTGATNATLTVTPAATTNYIVNATNTFGCVSSDTATVTVSPALVIIPANNGPLCAGANLNFTCNTGVTWNWIGPNSYTSSLQNPTIINAQINSSGTYTLSITDANGCVGSGTTNVIINPLPIPTVTNNGPLCANQNLIFTSGGGTTYSWSGPNGFSSAQQNPVINASTTTASGFYTVTVANGNCQSKITTSVTVNPLPTITANGATICFNGTINLAATGGTGYSWSGPNNYTSAQQNPVILNATTNMSGAYVVTVTDNNGCINANVAQVTVNPSLIITASNNGPLCAGSTLNLFSNTGGIITWGGPNSFLSNQQNPSITNVQANTSGIYTVTVTNVTGCSGTATTNVVINPIPTSISPLTVSGCSPVCVNFANTSTVSGTCNWNFGDGITSNSCNPTHCFSGQGTFSAAFTLTDGNGCTGTSVATIIVYPTPHAEFNATPQPTTILEPEIHFTNTSSGANIVSYNWNFGDQHNSNQQNPTHVYTNAGNYPATLIVTTDHGCADTITKIIIIDEDFEIYVPNAFSPNGDGTNEIFMAKGVGISEFKLLIFDRWGNEVFHSDDLYFGWDGRYKNKGEEIVQQDVYVWKIDLTNNKGMKKELSGTVSLIK